MVILKVFHFEKYDILDKEENNKNRNYEILSNISIIDNSDITKDLENIINDEDIFSKFTNILNIYNKMISKNDDEIKLIYNLKNENKEYELNEYFNISNNIKDELKIKLKVINNIINISRIIYES